jgi:hypothetical protein
MVRDINLRSHASSQWKSYASCQRVLEQVWSASKKNRGLVDVYKPRPQRMIFVERAGDHPDAFHEPTVIKGPGIPQIRRFKRSSA